MASGPPAPEPASLSKSPLLVLQDTQVPRTFSPESNKTAQVVVTASPGPIEETQQDIGPQSSSNTAAETAIPPSSTKIPARQPNVASSASIRGRTSSHRDPASLHSHRRSSRSSSRSSNRSRRSGSSDSGDRILRTAKFDPLSTIRSEVSFHGFGPPYDRNDLEGVPQPSLEPQLSAWSTNRGSSSDYSVPFSPTVPPVRPISPPTQVELDNHVRVFTELDLESMPPRKRSYTRHRYMTQERKIGLAFLAVALPPLAVQRTIRGRCWKEVSLATVLWALGYVPGVIYAISVVMAPWQSIPESTDRKWMKRREEEDETLRRLRSYDTDDDDQDREKPRRLGWLRRRRFRHQSEPPPAQWTMGSMG